MNGIKLHTMGSKGDSVSASKISERQQRSKASLCLRHLAIPQVALGFLATAAGIVTILLGSLKPTFPFYIAADILTGIACITAGGFAYRIHSDTKNGKRKKKTHCLMTVYGCLILLCMCLSVLSLTLSAYVLYTCTDDIKPKPHCMFRKRPKLALAVTDIVIESFILVSSLMIFWKFSKYRSSFIIKTDSEVQRVQKVQREPRYKKRRGQESELEKQDVYIARCPTYPAYSSGNHVCMHCKPTSTRNGMYLPTGLPPPYTRIAPY